MRGPKARLSLARGAPYNVELKALALVSNWAECPRAGDTFELTVEDNKLIRVTGLCELKKKYVDLEGCQCEIKKGK